MSLVEIENLHRHYTQGDFVIRALDGVDLTMEQGSFLALMGPSGSGKSTLLNVIGGLDTPTEGAVRIEGRDLATMTPAQRSDMRRDRLGFVFQSYNLIPVLTALENAAFVLQLQGQPPRVREERARRALALVGLEGMEHRRPGELSGGQQQRVAVARALAAEPALILADEPTANLDSHTGQALIELMRSLNEEQGTTFIFATHDPQVEEAARRVIRLVDGRVVEDERR